VPSVSHSDKRGRQAVFRIPKLKRIHYGNLFVVISEELTPSPSLSREGRKGDLGDLFIPRVYTQGYKHFIPPGFYMPTYMQAGFQERGEKWGGLNDLFIPSRSNRGRVFLRSEC